MFEKKREWLQAVNQQDVFATSLRLSLSALGPAGVLVGEFVTNFVPNQRLDRLQDFIERLAVEMTDGFDAMKARLDSSASYAALSEQVLLSAVKTPEPRRRRDLASVLRVGLSHDDARLEGDLALVRLLDGLNEPQIVHLVSYGIKDQSFASPTRAAFIQLHPGVFDLEPIYLGQDPEGDHGNRVTLQKHYRDGLVTAGLLRYADGDVRPVGDRQAEITLLGRMLLRLIDRSAEADIGVTDENTQQQAM